MTAQNHTVEEEYPLAAQIPLSSFTLPAFPATASKLRALTLTSDISLSDYQSKHLAPGTFEAPVLPNSITHLTLELFSLGLPNPFLTSLGNTLPNLQSLTLFCTLVDGLDAPSRHDATQFFRLIGPNLQELHVVDSFARPGFWTEVSSFCNDLKVLEVSYTYRGHYESDFLNRTGGEEWSGFMKEGLVGLTLHFAPPVPAGELEMKAENSEDQKDLRSGDGILPYAGDGRASSAVVKRAMELQRLKVLDLTMYTMNMAQIGQILKNTQLAGLSVSVLADDEWYDEWMESLKDVTATELETLEMVMVPKELKQELTMEDTVGLSMRNPRALSDLSKNCPKLSKFEQSVLKSRKIKPIKWEKEDGKWTASTENTFV